MAERSDRAPARWRQPFLRWLDGVETGWAVPLLIACFVAVWTLYLAIAYAGGGLHPDTLEGWTLGRNFAWGYHKHPPLMGWVTSAWTSVFPLTDWSLLDGLTDINLIKSNADTLLEAESFISSAEVDALGARLAFFNIFGVPILVAAFALVLGLIRRKRMRRSGGTA